MKVLLTGGTGNLGSEVLSCLKQKKIPYLATTRNAHSFNEDQNFVLADLVSDESPMSVFADCTHIIHAAGDVRLTSQNEDNNKIMKKVIQISRDTGAPVIYISTAFLYREHQVEKFEARNCYEQDKWNSEELLRKSGIRYQIIRPSVLVGNSTSGEIVNFTGYYTLVHKFLEAAHLARTRGEKIRFPVLSGFSDMVTVDQVADSVIEVLEKDDMQNKTVYVTNPKRPRAQWVLEETLDFFQVDDVFDFIPISFSEYSVMEGKNTSEDMLCLIGNHMHTYWSLAYEFPETLCTENLVNKKYISQILMYYKNNHESSS